MQKKLWRHHPHPPLPPPRGRVRVGGQRAPGVKFCDRRKNPYGPLNARVKAIFWRNLLHLLSKLEVSNVKCNENSPFPRLLRRRTSRLRSCMPPNGLPSKKHSQLKACALSFLLQETGNGERWTVNCKLWTVNRKEGTMGEHPHKYFPNCYVAKLRSC